MIDPRCLSQVIKHLITRNGEGVYWDFKRKHHTARSYNAWIIQKEFR